MSISTTTMNTYPTTAEQLYLEQKMRDEANMGCQIEARNTAMRRNEVAINMATTRRKNRLLFEEKQKQREETVKKWTEDQIAGYASKRYDYPEYHWWMIQDGKKYLRSSKNFNVYDYEKSCVIVGTWNEETQRIEFVNDNVKKIRDLEEIVSKISDCDESDDEDEKIERKIERLKYLFQDRH